MDKVKRRKTLLNAKKALIREIKECHQYAEYSIACEYEKTLKRINAEIRELGK